MDQQDQQKHVCTVCDRIFPCGQSLGGHMRSHVVNLVTSDDDDDDDDVAKLSLPISTADENGETSTKSIFQQSSSTHNHTSYGLRENPKKTNRFTRLRKEVARDENLCKLCGKGFQSSKALFGHMKCHSEKLIIGDTTIEEEVSSQSDGNEEAVNAQLLLYSRRRSRRMTRNKISYASSENEREKDVAMSLMMLSKDSWGSNEVYSDDDTAVLTTMKGNDGGKRTRKEVCLDESYSYKNTVYDAEELGFDKIRVSKRNKFQCATCKKIFHSFQALGGHRASHKKIKGCYASKFDSVSENSIEQSHLTITEIEEIRELTNEGLRKGKSKEHECPLCLKIFSSGQALGGHKRSHLLNSSSSGIKTNQSIVIQEPIMIDLNLPARPTTEEDHGTSPSGQVAADFSIKQWWGMESPIGFSL